MDGLNRLITKDKNEGRLKGVRIVDNIILSHLLFLDDILIFLDGNTNESYVFNTTLNYFFKAIRMVNNQENFILTTFGCSQLKIDYAPQRFPHTILTFEDELNYLGFRLKPNNYRISNWTWLVAKVGKRINIWHHQWLSREGNLVLIKSILEAILVYWMSFTWIPKRIISRIQQLGYKPLWRGAN